MLYSIENRPLKIHRALDADGKFLIDFDNKRRMIKYLRANPTSPYSFDTQSSTLAKQGESPVRYFSSEEIVKYLRVHNLDLTHIYGDYQGSEYIENDEDQICPRMIIIGEKRP